MAELRYRPPGPKGFRNVALTNAQKQKAWRERRSAYIRQLEARIAQLEREQAKGKRPRRRETDRERGGSAVDKRDKRDKRARMNTQQQARI